MALARPNKCPTCRRPVGWEGNPYRPFCSERCQMADLGNWALERYRIAGEPVSSEAPSGGEDDGAAERPRDENREE